MAVEIKVPRLGWSMEEGTFIEWLKRDGESVKAGEPLFAIEGDKSIQEIEAIGSGMLRISPSAPESGETVKVGVTLAFLVDGDEAPPFASAGVQQSPTAAASRQEPRRSEPASPPAKPASPARAPGKTLRVSPRAARAALRLGLDPQQIEGSGKNGRIRERDVIAASSGTQAAAKATAQPSFRRTIAARMLESAQATAPVTLTTTADATNLVSLRLQFKAAAGSSPDRVPSYSDLIVKLTARALLEHPALNQQWVDGRLVSPEGIHIAVAVDTQAGLVAPVLRDVGSLGVREIAAKSADLQSRALGASLRPEELTGGTFTVSNLGSFGIDVFTPIVNLPQCAILGIGRIDRRPAVVGDQIVPRDQVTLSLTFDHRVVDGAPAARFLASIRGGIENPGPWLVF